MIKIQDLNRILNELFNKLKTTNCINFNKKYRNNIITFIY